MTADDPPIDDDREFDDGGASGDEAHASGDEDGRAPGDGDGRAPGDEDGRAPGDEDGRAPGDGDWQPSGDGIDHTPTVTCSRCDRAWDLSYELDERHAGNDAVEQFALDHQRHTGHFPDDVTPWLVDCRHCPSGDQFLSERPARRWARTHARHTGHPVDLAHDPDVSTTVSPEADQ